MKKVYLLDGRLEGPDARDLPIPQNYDIFTLAELCRWYADYGAEGSRKSQADLAS